MLNSKTPPLALLLILSSSAVQAAGPPCQPCAGVRVADPAAVLDALAADPRVQGEERLYVSWPVELDGTADPASMSAVLERGGTPWMVVRFRTPAPLLDHVTTLEGELRDLARLARGASERAHFQLAWEPASGEPSAKDFAFLVKRAAVAVTGARADARVLIGPLAPDVDWLRTLYDEEVAAYVDGLALRPADRAEIEAMNAAFTELDPGKGVALDALAWPDAAASTLPRAAEWNRAGIAVSFFERLRPSAEDLLPLKILAREFQGDLSFDPSSVPQGADAAWTYVRGEDLGLRVIAEAEPGSDLTLFFEDPQLRSPVVVDAATGEEETAFGQQRTARGLLVPVDEAGAAVLLRLERMTAAELEGLEERLTVEDERQVPVEEILRRLQAFEDAQARRLDHYQATHTLHMRFNLGTGLSSIEATFRGEFFYRQGEGFDWAWDELFFNGVKWKRKKLPEIPLIQPEKSATLPLEINFTKEYRYRLRGTATVEGRDCWVVDFAPAEAVPEGKVLNQGTVWVDREIYARVKTRAVQVGLQGEVISNEETLFHTPVDASGEAAPWSPESFVLPTRSVGQQLLSILNATTQLERQTELTDIRINGEAFTESRQAKLDSESTMVRDTAKGMRYLVRDEASGARVVKDEFDVNHKFLVAGTFYDASLDFPLPLAGINYLSRDFRGTGLQVNGFFAGPLLVGSLANPRLFGSHWDAGMNVFGFLVPGTERISRDGVEVPAEEIETGANGRVAFFVGRPLGDFWKLDFTYRLRWDSFDSSDETAEDFILPKDGLTQAFETSLAYKRGGYNLLFEGSFNQRSDWECWGLPANCDDVADPTDEFDPEEEDYVRWRVSAGKTWWLPRFMKFGLSASHLDGSDLDRFSKYEFDFFSDARVAGYQDGLVTAEEASGLHLVYGFELGKVIRVQLQGDAVWASDEATGLEDELLAGLSLNGTLIGPWGTIVNFDVGVPVEGPADDFVAYVVFLKLFGK